jgi:hypothetical protein
MQILRLVAGVVALVGLGLHGWLLAQLGRWSQLPRRKPAPKSLVVLYASGGLGMAGAGVVGVWLPWPTGSPWEHFAIALWSLGFAWLLQDAVKYQLLHVRAYAATRRLFSIAERLAAQHGSDAADVRRVADGVLSYPPPDDPAQPWHGSTPRWTADLFDAAQRHHLTDAARTELDSAMARCLQAASRFDGYRR